MNVLILGVAGWLGEATAEFLSEHYTVRLFDTRRGKTPGEWVIGDIADYEAVLAAMDGMDGFVHLACPSNVEDYRESTLPFHTITRGTYHVLEAARYHRARRGIFLSTTAVVAYPNGTPITRDSAPFFKGTYGMSKWLAEEMCRYYAETYEMGIVVLRPNSIVDARHDSQKGDMPALSASPYHAYAVCRYDLALAMRLGLEAESVRFDLFHIIAAREGRQYFDVDRAEEILDWVPAEDFERFRNNAPA